MTPVAVCGVRAHTLRLESKNELSLPHATRLGTHVCIRAFTPCFGSTVCMALAAVPVGVGAVVHPQARDCDITEF